MMLNQNPVQTVYEVVSPIFFLD